jgi:hypothetical protein
VTYGVGLSKDYLNESMPPEWGQSLANSGKFLPPAALSLHGASRIRRGGRDHCEAVARPGFDATQNTVWPKGGRAIRSSARVTGMPTLS